MGDSLRGIAFLFLHGKRTAAECWNGIGGGMSNRKQSATGKGGAVKAAKLCREAHRVLEEEAGGIAGSLVKKAMQGNIPSTRLLLELAESDVDEGQAEGPVRSLALRLEAEPQWPAEATGAAGPANADGADADDRRRQELEL